MRGLLFANVLRAADGIDWKEIVCEVAERHPQTVANIIANVTSSTEPSWMAEVRNEAHGNSKVPPIKLMRTLTGAGLREAKQWVENDPVCCANGGWNHVPCSEFNPYITL